MYELRRAAAGLLGEEYGGVSRLWMDMSFLTDLWNSQQTVIKENDFWKSSWFLTESCLFLMQHSLRAWSSQTSDKQHLAATKAS